MEIKEIDIYSKGEYPANVLSNFYPNEFVFDGMKCGSMEGFLQSLKYVCPKKQRAVCALSGKEAKEAGANKFLWKLLHEAFWQGKRYGRLSPEYRALVLRAYRAMYAQNKDVRKALAASRGKKLCHSIGSHNPKKTILTEREFICCLYNI